MTRKEALEQIMAWLRAREISAFQSFPLPDDPPAVAFSVKAAAVQRFLDALIPAPLDGDDSLALHIVGRPQDLTASEEPWRFDSRVGTIDDSLATFGAGALELWVTVHIPIDDLPEVVRRLGMRKVGNGA